MTALTGNGFSPRQSTLYDFIYEGGIKKLRLPLPG